MPLKRIMYLENFRQNMMAYEENPHVENYLQLTYFGGDLLSDMKKTYYIYVANGQISQDRESSPWNFKVEATDKEITRLREYFDQNYSTEIQNFYRAQVPYIQYHYDRENDAYDETLKKVYEMIHELGNEEAKNHIESMGILESNPATDGFSQ